MKQALIDKRLRGELPIIEIDGDKYIIDWRLKELRCQSDISKRIDLSRMDMNTEGTAYIGFYNTRDKQVLYNEHEIPNTENIAVLSIPYELKLDPVGVARQYGLEDTELLKTYPIQEDLKAKLIPVVQKKGQKAQHDVTGKQNNHRRKGKRL